MNMINIGLVGFLLIIINVVVSYNGFKSNTLFGQYKFEVNKIFIQKNYQRLITSGFLHVDWLHLVFNMMSLYAFCGLLEIYLGEGRFLFIYFVSLLGGNLLALFIHRNHGDYSAVGASGAICGVIFASIALFPQIEIGFFGLPFRFPSWLYGFLYVLYSIYGIKNNNDNIGHEAHLGGGFAGIITAILFQPASLSLNYLPIVCIVTPTAVFLYLLIRKPHILMVDTPLFEKKKTYHTIEDKYNEMRYNKQEEINRLLDKISSKGIESLSTKEKTRLDEFSK